MLRRRQLLSLLALLVLSCILDPRHDVDEQGPCYSGLAAYEVFVPHSSPWPVVLEPSDDTLHIDSAEKTIHFRCATPLTDTFLQTGTYFLTIKTVTCFRDAPPCNFNSRPQLPGQKISLSQTGDTLFNPLSILLQPQKEALSFYLLFQKTQFWYDPVNVNDTIICDLHFELDRQVDGFPCSSRYMGSKRFILIRNYET